MVTIIDYGMGNLASVKNMFKRIGVSSQISSDLEVIKKSNKLLLPGVGSFDNAMKKINSSGLREILDSKVIADKTPILGICLGMQLITNGSEEGHEKGLGWIDAKTLKFKKINNIKVPHMGWNNVIPSNESALTKKINSDSRFYFVHSYYVKVKHQKNSILKTFYGYEFDSAISNKNIYGTQFHPEKSHKFGMQLFKNFAKI